MHTSINTALPYKQGYARVAAKNANSATSQTVPMTFSYRELTPAESALATQERDYMANLERVQALGYEKWRDQHEARHPNGNLDWRKTSKYFS
jgi:hypothetical protein